MHRCMEGTSLSLCTDQGSEGLVGLGPVVSVLQKLDVQNGLMQGHFLLISLSQKHILCLIAWKREIKTPTKNE